MFDLQTLIRLSDPALMVYGLNVIIALLTPQLSARRLMRRLADTKRNRHIFNESGLYKITQ